MLLAVLAVLVLFCIPLDVLGQTPAIEYSPLVGLPELGDAATGKGLGAYFNKLYLIAISIGAFIAFVKISIAGVKWSFDEIVTHKSDAKKEIQGALLGLTILLVPAIVLGTINPKLLSLDFLQNATPLDTSVSSHKKASGVGNATGNSGDTFTAGTPQVCSGSIDDCRARCEEKGGRFDMSGEGEDTYCILGSINLTQALAKAKQYCEGGFDGKAKTTNKFLLIPGKNPNEFNSYYCAGSKTVTKNFSYTTATTKATATSDCQKLTSGKVSKDNVFPSGGGYIECSYLSAPGT